MSELAALQRLSTPTQPSFHTSIPPSSPLMRTTNSPKHFDQFNTSLLLPRMPALSSRTPSLFEMQTMGYGFRGAHIGGCPHGVTPRLDSSNSKSAVDAAASSEYRHGVEVPPCPSPRIQTQDRSMPAASWSTASTSVQKSLPQVDDQVQVSYYQSI
jgi:hypothetical protein